MSAALHGCSVRWTTYAASLTENVTLTIVPDETVETARRFLRSLRAARDTENFVARFIDSMDPEEAALLDGLAELDRRDGPPAFVADERDPQE